MKIYERNTEEWVSDSLDAKTIGATAAAGDTVIGPGHGPYTSRLYATVLRVREGVAYVSFGGGIPSDHPAYGTPLMRGTGWTLCCRGSAAMMVARGFEPERLPCFVVRGTRCGEPVCETFFSQDSADEWVDMWRQWQLDARPSPSTVS